MAQKTLVALFDDRADYQNVLSELGTAGIRSSDIQTVEHSNYSLSGGSNLLSRLRDRGVPDSDAHLYAEGVRRGGSLIIANVDEDKAHRAANILNRRSAVDIERRGEHYRSSGWSRFDETAPPYDEATISSERSAYADTDEEVIPIVEEELEIGKRAVSRGSVRVRSYVTEVPVEEQVTLRDETVSVERRAATDRVIGDADFQDRTVEMSETDEEAVVSKRARHKEDVVIRKEAEERVETVKDTVRRTDVDIQNDTSKHPDR